MRYLAFILVTALAVTALGTHRVITSGDLPYTITRDTSNAYDTIMSAGNLTSTAGVITISSGYGVSTEPYDIVLYFGSDTITWGTGGTTCVAVTIQPNNAYAPHDITLVGGVWDHEPTGTPNACRWMTYSGNDMLIRDVEADVEGTNAKCVYSSVTYAPGSYNNIFKNCVWTNRGMGFTSRCNYDAATVHVVNPFWTPISDSGATYHVWFDSCTIADGPHTGFVLVGHETDSARRMVSKTTNCTIQTDARNTTYSSYSGTCYSSANPYGIVLRHVGRGSELRNNTITSGTTYGGSRGILIEYGWGSDSLPVVVAENDVNCHEGPNVEFGSSNDVHGLRIRYSPRVINVDSNSFYVWADTASATAHTGANAHTVRISNAQSATGVGKVTLTNNDIGNGGLGNVQLYACNFDDVDYDSTIFMVGNNIWTGGVVYKIGDYNDRARGIVIVGDTVAFNEVSLSTQGQYTYYLGELGNMWDCQNNTARDVTYQSYVGGASDDDITLSSNIAGIRELTVQRTFTGVVAGRNDLPVINAQFVATNAYGDTVLSGYSDSGGVVTGIINYIYKSQQRTYSQTPPISAQNISYSVARADKATYLVPQPYDSVVGFCAYLRSPYDSVVTASVGLYRGYDGVPITRLSTATYTRGDPSAYVDTAWRWSETSVTRFKPNVDSIYVAAIGAPTGPESYGIQIASEYASHGYSEYGTSATLPATWSETTTGNQRMALGVAFRRDSLDLNPLRLVAKQGADSTVVSSFTLGWLANMATDTLVLANTDGTGEWGGTGEPPATYDQDYWRGNVIIQGAVRIE